MGECAQRSRRRGAGRGFRGTGLALALGLLPGLAVAAGPGLPEPPRATVPAPVASTGRVLEVPAGGDLQQALLAALPGDTIELEAGAVYRGSFRLPRKAQAPGADPEWITLRSGGAPAALPPAGTRVTPGHADAMAKLEAVDGPALVAEAGASHYRLVGLEFRPAPPPEEGGRNFINALLWLGVAGATGEAVPHHIVVERSYLHGDPRHGARRGIVLNSAATAIVDSHFADFKMTGGDSQAIIGWAGPGPFRIQNNHLEGAGENLMFGGADPGVRDRVPSDIEILGNRFTKPLAWKEGDPAYAGTRWTVKNLLELKNARRVRISGNLFEYNWPESQNGFAILFTVRNQDGGAPWSVVEDVSFTDNLVRHVANGINILARDDNHPSQPLRRVRIANNLFTDLGGAWGAGDFLQVLDGAEDLSVEHNTVLNGAVLLRADGRANPRFALRGNIARHNEYAIVGTGTAPGMGALERYFPGAIVEGNLIIGGEPGQLPPRNEFAGSEAEVGFRAPEAGNYRLDCTLESKRGEGHGAPLPGADLDVLCAALAPPDRPAFCGGGRA